MFVIHRLSIKHYNKSLTKKTRTNTGKIEKSVEKCGTDLRYFRKYQLISFNNWRLVRFKPMKTDASYVLNRWKPTLFTFWNRRKPTLFTFRNRRKPTLLTFWNRRKQRFLRLENDEKRRFLRLNTDENRSNRRKKRKGFDRFWRSKSDENRRFLMFESDEILNTTRVVLRFD